MLDLHDTIPMSTLLYLRMDSTPSIRTSHTISTEAMGPLIVNDCVPSVRTKDAISSDTQELLKMLYSVSTASLLDGRVCCAKPTRARVR